MNADRLEQIDEIFQSALDLPLQRQADFLDAECRGDVELRAEVESLLAAHQDAGDFIEDSASDVAASLLEKNPRRPGQVGQYKIEKLLGAGGMGEVYLAIDKMGRRVALKLLARRLIKDQQHVSRFLQEARTVLALNHPNIVTVYDIGEADGTYYIASELIEGETLGRTLETSELKLSEVLEISIQVAAALAAAHEKGIVHRDIKPDNVMVRGDGYVKVLDFGIAKLTEDFAEAVSPEAPTRPKLQTAEGIVIGTASYMSPEQARGLKVDVRADIWSCGAMLYEMITGQTPFSGGSAADVVARILEREPAPLARYVKDPPVELQRIISKALTKNRGERYQTMKDMLLDLKALKQEMEFAAKLERLSAPGEGPAYRTDGAAAEQSTPELITHTNTRPVSSAEYIVTEIKQHKRGVLIAFSVLLLAAIVLSVWSFAHRSASSAQIESIAVLPFINASGNSDVEYLSDGMTESLINSLSHLPGVSVKARSSVFRYKGREIEPQQAASELSVQAILSGRVVQRGDNLTLYLSLVDGRNGNQIWGDQYDRKLTELVTLQNEIARDVSQKLQARLSGAEERKIAKTYTANTEAYKLYLQGRYHILKLTLSEVQTSISYFQQAIAIDPSYALAYVGLADAYRSSLVGDMAPTEVLTKAKSAAQKAVELDDSLADAHAELGFVIFWLDWDWKAAEAQYKRALDLDPNNADAHLFYAHLLSNTGQHAEALAQASSAYIEKRMFAEAIAEAQKARKFSGPTNSHPVAFLGYALAKSSRQTEARVLVEELVKASTERYVSAYNIAMIYNGLDEREKALEWLEQAYKNRDQKMVFLKVEPKWNNLRDEARFQNLLRRVGF